MTTFAGIEFADITVTEQQLSQLADWRHTDMDDESFIYTVSVIVDGSLEEEHVFDDFDVAYDCWDQLTSKVEVELRGENVDWQVTLYDAFENVNKATSGYQFGPDDS